jgi:hypothetical protein
VNLLSPFSSLLQAFVSYIFLALVYPDLETIKIQYRPDLTDRDQAQIDLKSFVQMSKKSILSLDTKIKDVEKAGKPKLNDRSQEVVSTFKKKLNSAKSTASDLRGSDEKSVVESTAKPRSLLPTFLRANDKNPAPGRSDITDLDSNPASAKKVHWREDYSESDLENVDYGTQTAVEMAKGSAKRKAFGSNGFVGRKYSHGSKTSELGTSSRSLFAGSSRLSSVKEDTKKERVGDKRSPGGNEQLSKSFSKSDSKRCRVSSVHRSNDALGDLSGNVKIKKPAVLSRSVHREFPSIPIHAEERNSQDMHSNHEKPKNLVNRSTIGKTAGIVSGTTKTNHASRKMESSGWDESKTEKKRASSTQFSGISSQERPSKGRRRKRVMSGASVGSKPGRSNFVDEEYSFNFIN